MRSLEMTLKDMTCGHCSSAVTKTVKAVDADATVDIDLATKKVIIGSDRDAAVIRKALSDAGYPPG
jgi:copper chaperone CopZ